MTTYKPAEKVDMNGDDDDDDGDDEGTLTAKLLLELSDRIMSLEREIKSSKIIQALDMSNDTRSSANKTSSVPKKYNNTLRKESLCSNDSLKKESFGGGDKKEGQIRRNIVEKDDQSELDSSEPVSNLSLSPDNSKLIEESDDDNVSVISVISAGSADSAVHVFGNLDLDFGRGIMEKDKSARSLQAPPRRKLQEKEKNTSTKSLPNPIGDTVDDSSLSVASDKLSHSRTSADLLRAFNVQKMKNRKKAKQEKNEYEIMQTFSRNVLR
jgi:hypothetical protein